ncbi:hypothetical protein ABDK09_13600 [Vibrio sp. CDRSL-10 TSBA]
MNKVSVAMHDREKSVAPLNHKEHIMKFVTKLIAVSLLALSAPALASNVIESLSIETIKHTMTKDQITTLLTDWKNERIANIHYDTSLLAQKIPAGLVHEVLRAQIEYDYNKAATAFGL